MTFGLRRANMLGKLFAQLVSKIFNLSYVVMINQRHRQTDKMQSQDCALHYSTSLGKNHGLGQYGAKPHYSMIPFSVVSAVGCCVILFNYGSKMTLTGGYCTKHQCNRATMLYRMVLSTKFNAKYRLTAMNKCSPSQNEQKNMIRTLCVQLNQYT